MTENDARYNLDPQVGMDDVEGHSPVTWDADRPKVETRDDDDVTGHVGEISTDVYGDESRTP